MWPIRSHRRQYSVPAAHRLLIVGRQRLPVIQRGELLHRWFTWSVPSGDSTGEWRLRSRVRRPDVPGILPIPVPSIYYRLRFDGEPSLHSAQEPFITIAKSSGIAPYLPVEHRSPARDHAQPAGRCELRRQSRRMVHVASADTQSFNGLTQHILSHLTTEGPGGAGLLRRHLKYGL